MGSLCGKSEVTGRKQLSVILIGPRGSGKTTALYQLKLNEKVDTTPTTNFIMEEIMYKGWFIGIWDISGPVLYRHYIENTDCIIFMVDSSSDPSKMDDNGDQNAKDYLAQVLSERDLKQQTPLLVLANKQDESTAMSGDNIAEVLGLHDIGDQRPWKVQECIASSGNGLWEGIEWIHQILDLK